MVCGNAGLLTTHISAMFYPVMPSLIKRQIFSQQAIFDHCHVCAKVTVDLTGHGTSYSDDRAGFYNAQVENTASSSVV